MQYFRSIVFNIYMVAETIVFSTILALMLPLPLRYHYKVACAWAEHLFGAAKLICNLDYTIEGRENLPDEPTVVYYKHSSAWEAIQVFTMFPTQCWVIKRELMWVPFVGWALKKFRPIAIDRSAGHSAVEQVVEQGKERLAEGRWVVIFPEGTRVKHGTTRRYGLSGALLAKAAGMPIVPIAHNSGRYWPRRGLLKKAGTIRMVIGKPISTIDRDPRDLNSEIQTWMEDTIREIDSRG